MKLSRQFTVFGSAIFCVVIFSLYLMLDRGHLDYPRGPRREGSFPQVSTWRRGWRASLGGSHFSQTLILSAPGQGEATPDDQLSLIRPRLGRARTAKFAKCWASFGDSFALSRSGLVRAFAPGPVECPRAPADREPAWYECRCGSPPRLAQG